MDATVDLIQGSDEWKRARAGSLGASQIHEALARTKNGWGASRANIIAQLVIERLTGEPSASFESAAMAWGREKEADARDAYSFYHGVKVAEVGIIKHPLIDGTHCSPDGLVGEDGLVELKAPNSSTHLDILLTKKFPAKYELQAMWQMACSGRKWCDLASFDPRFPEHLKLFVRRVHRDDKHIEELETEVIKFLSEVEDKVASLNALSEAA
jgi:hypothetical protein